MTREQAAQNSDVCRAYGETIRATIEASVLKRIEESEGRVPGLPEVREHGGREVTLNGSVVYFWRGKPIVEYQAAGYDRDGEWRDAVISEISEAAIQTP